MTWTPERIVELRRLFATGATFAAIGRALGVSKNSAISKARQLGLARPAEVLQSPHARALAAYRAASKIDPPSRYAEFPPSSRCVFPHGHPGAPRFGFCCAPVAGTGLPYCPDHMRVAYKPAATSAQDKAA